MIIVKNILISATWVQKKVGSRFWKSHDSLENIKCKFCADKTIHRCQGDTLGKAVVDLPSSKQEHMHYVSLSRLRNISGLHILNLNENNISVSWKAQEEMTRLRENALLKSHIPFLYKDTSRAFKILCQNVRSLHLLFPDVATDYNAEAAAVNIFVETALCSNDTNFQLFRNDFMSHDTRTPYGTAVYVQENVELLSEPLKCNYNDVEMTLIKVSQPVTNLHIVEIYRSKSKVKTSKFIDALRNLHSNFINDSNVPVILLGDFNIKFIENASEKKNTF